MISRMTEADFEREFLVEFAHLECGEHFDQTRAQHVAWVKNRITTFRLRGARFYVHTLDDGSPTGFAVVLIEPGLDDRVVLGRKAELLDIMVREAFRGAGIGGSLLEHAEREAREVGAYCLYVSTTANDRNAIRFYVERDFTPVALHPDVHGPGGFGEVHLRKIIGGPEPAAPSTMNPRGMHP